MGDERDTGRLGRLRALASFLPVFESPGFEIGAWNPSERGPDGTLYLGGYSLSSTGEAFISAAYEDGWVVPGFDWMAWSQSVDGRRLLEDPERWSAGTEEQLAHLLTTVIRSERFGDGSIARAYESGLLTAILRRASSLAAESSPSGHIVGTQGDPSPGVVIHGPPATDSLVLEHRPQVLSWDKAGTWAQERLIPYRDEVAQRFAHVEGDGLSFRLECGLGPTTDLEAAGDLDNLLIPVLDALGHSRFVAAWGTKHEGSESRLTVGPPSVMTAADLADWSHTSVRATTSAGSEPGKEEIAAQLAACEPLPPDVAAALIVAFRVGPGRAWHNLWKPAIDALGVVLGVPGPRRWHPRDGRITELGLTVEVIEALGWNVLIDYWWQARPW